MKFDKLIQPIDSFDFLFSRLAPYMHEKKLKKNERCYIDSLSTIMLLRSGEITVVNDGFSNKIKAPFLFGLVGCLNFSTQLAFRATNSTRCYLVSTNEALSVIKSENLWEDVCKIIAYNNMLAHLIYSQMRATTMTTTDRVAKAVEIIFHLQQKNNVQYFLAKEVMSLTLLSRSIVMKNIGFLKNEKIITTEKGRLISIDKSKLHVLVKNNRIV